MLTVDTSEDDIQQIEQNDQTVMTTGSEEILCLGSRISTVRQTLSLTQRDLHAPHVFTRRRGRSSLVLGPWVAPEPMIPERQHPNRVSDRAVHNR